VSLSLKISKKAGDRIDVIASRSWPQNKISIGRGAECTLVLDDEKKYVSRVHVELEEVEDGAFKVTVVSKVNPIFVNNRKHGPGSEISLGAGDRFEVGEYVIEMLAPPPPGPRVPNPVAEVEETTRPDNPMMKEMRSAMAAQPAAAPAPEPPPAPPPVAPAVAPAEEAALFAETTFIGKKPAADEEVFDITAPGIGGTAPEPDVFGEATYVGAKQTTNVLDEATYLGSRPQTPGAPSAAIAEDGIRRAVAAFLEGAGLSDKDVPAADAEAFLRQSGMLVRAAVEGAMALLAARATAKKELRAEERTMVASRDNNPLKLMSDPQEVLAFLFDSNKDRTGGFLEPVQAVSDAFEDLRVHEVALFAGMRAALLGAIQRFDPKALEAELEKKSGSLGLNRKAKLWELFAGYQEKLAREAGDDFNKVFGREFMGTYMEQVKRLRGSRQ
jgi:type VI secretion system FHA domain protein